jgi:nucleotide-binding universal stress UspA family protein
MMGLVQSNDRLCRTPIALLSRGSIGAHRGTITQFEAPRTAIEMQPARDYVRRSLALSPAMPGQAQEWIMKTFLALIEGSADRAVLEAAHLLAKALTGHVDAVHIDVSVAESAAFAPHVDFARGPALQTSLKDIETRAAGAAAGARSEFDSLCARYGVAQSHNTADASRPTASFRQEKSAGLDALIGMARHHDLTIVGRPSAGSPWSRRLVERLLVETGRPLLIVPDGTHLSSLATVTICWKEDSASARALSAALPIIQKASNAVIVTVREGAGQTSEGVKYLASQLGWHGIEARAEFLWDTGRPAIEHLRSAAAAHGANLMVMGAFSRSPTRELLFGGCTQAILEAADRPVFLLH